MNDFDNTFTYSDSRDYINDEMEIEALEREQCEDCIRLQKKMDDHTTTCFWHSKTRLKYKNLDQALRAVMENFNEKNNKSIN